MGALYRDDGLVWRDRHLGLVPVIEDPVAVGHSLDRLATQIAKRVDLHAVLALARGAPPLTAVPQRPANRSGTARVAVAGGPAFSFTYPENLERLEQAGAELLPFDPLVDGALPAAATALYVGGGFPEVLAEQLAGNEPLLDDVRRRVGSGLATWAECGGLLWLARTLGEARLSGVVPADALMTDSLTLGYREATVRVSNPVAGEGDVLRGHEFHYSALDPPGDAFELRGTVEAGAAPSAPRLEGFATPTMLASYVHLHLGADPGPAERFVAAAGSAPAGIS
jgi:cobyrinic acid a,c-diamide synthase